MRLGLVLMSALAVASAAATEVRAQQPGDHAEECTEPSWGYLRSLSFNFGTINTCGEPINVWFKFRGDPAVMKRVEPGQTFDTGLSIAEFEKERQSNGWIAATCPAGTIPSVEFNDDNWDQILKSRYECRPQ